MKIGEQDYGLGNDTMAFADSAVYQIVVAGRLDSSWSARLGGMQITPEKKLENNKYVYHLIGMLKDQSELNGILNSLYELHMTLLSIRKL